MLKHKFFAFSTLLVLSCGSTSPERKNEELKKSNFQYTNLTEKQKAYYTNNAALLYTNLLQQKGFSGQILLAKNGEIVFEDYQGILDKKNNTPINNNTPLHIASTSKTFTAMVILKLMEQGKLQLDDLVSKYLPGFPYNNVTIKNLLTHRSGLPNYTNFMDGGNTEIIIKRNKKGRIIKRIKIKRLATVPSEKFVTNNSLLQYLIDKRPQTLASPNRVFNYCNTNFALLALIAEKITSIDFPTYVKDSVFTPLGMQNSYVFSIKDTNKYIPSYQYNWAPYPLQKLDCVYGDKNVYSTVRDLYLWDKALYEGTYVSTETLKLAFTGYSNEKRGTHNYGLGFRLLMQPQETVVYHNGWWHGNNSVFKRLIHDTATVIIIGNKFNKGIYAAGKISSIFTGYTDTTKTID